MERSDLFIGAPEVYQIVKEADLLAYAAQHPIVPLLDGQAAAILSEIQNRHRVAVFAEADGGPGHQGGLAHLAGIEDITELALAQAFQQIRVCLSHDIGRRIVRESSTRDEESFCCNRHSSFLPAHLRAYRYSTRFCHLACLS